jgi:DNA-directed RNA polymerase specialized sigma24 family protein
MSVAPDVARGGRSPRAAERGRAQTQPTPLSPAASARLDALYRDYARDLVGKVAHRVRCHRDEVEDACQFAWAVLARRPDVLESPTVRAWLSTVAVHECIADRRAAPVLTDTLDHWSTAPPLDDVLEVREALRVVARLRPVRKRVFERHLAGLSYAEIVAEQGVTYTNVNRQMRESRAELRAAG